MCASAPAARASDETRAAPGARRAAPPRTLAPVVSDADAEQLQQRHGQRKLGAQGLELRSFKAEELSGFSRAEIAKWADLVKRSGAQVD
jgi:hypothetical protein